MVCEDKVYNKKTLVSMSKQQVKSKLEYPFKF